MRSGINPSRFGNFSTLKYSVKNSLLFIFLIAFGFQGCVVHKHGHRHRSYAKPSPVTFTFDNHHRQTVRNYYHRHPLHYHGNKHDPRQQWKYKRKAYFPRGIQMQVIPADLARQLPPAPRGTRYIYHDDQILLVNVNTRLVLDFINIPVAVEHRNAYNRKPAPKIVDQIPSYEDQQPSHRPPPPPHARSHEVAKGKPFTEDRHPSSHGEEHTANPGNAFGKHKSHDDRSSLNHEKKVSKDPHHDNRQQPVEHHPNQEMRSGKPDKKKDHSAFHGQDKNRPEDSKGKNPEMAQGHREKNNHPRGASPDKGKNFEKKKEQPDSQVRSEKEKGRPDNHHMKSSSSHAKKDKDIRGERHLDNPGDESSKGQDHPSTDKEKHAFKNPVTGDRESNPKHAGKNQEKKKDKKQREEKGKPKDRASDHVEQERSPEPSFLTPEENIQIAKADPDRVKGHNPKKAKSRKNKPGKREKQMEDSAPAMPPQVSAVQPAHPETSTASLAAAQFDSHQRTLIQKYYQNSRTSSSSKGKVRGKSAKKSKSGAVSINDIFTQHTEALPHDLESQLPPPPPNTMRGVYNQQVLLIENGTRKVLDVIDWNR